MEAKAHASQTPERGLTNITHSVFTEHTVWKLRRSLCIVFRVHVSTLTTAQQERFDKRPVAKSKGLPDLEREKETILKEIVSWSQDEATKKSS